MKRFQQCLHCPCAFDCETHGCYAWNDQARKKIDQVHKQRDQITDDQILNAFNKGRVDDSLLNRDVTEISGGDISQLDMKWED